MRKISLKFAVGFLALVVGSALAWASGIYRVLFPSPANLAAPATETPAQQQSIRGQSGKVLTHSKGFEYGKEWVANFEIVNETAQPIFYVGSKRKGKIDYCTLGVKHGEPFPANHDGKIDNLTFKIRDECYYNTSLTLQMLEPGESMTLSVGEDEVRGLRHIKDSKQKTTAQIGFEFFVGEEKRREILWSEEIIFPYDEYR
ncbi:MAG TPA: hypothetical protein VK421_01390 [Pyrinomonadaceae bacterium]|nr:hypothetical protein [Pyrinomonadaceae bacterium]